MVKDPYAGARELVRSLSAAGMQGWASQVDDVVRGGSTATEILMGLRWNLAKLLETGTLTGVLEAQARELYDAADRLLR